MCEHRLMSYENVDGVTWKAMREKMKNAEGIMAKFSAFSEWLHAKRHKGEWSEETKVSFHFHPLLILIIYARPVAAPLVVLQ